MDREDGGNHIHSPVIDSEQSLLIILNPGTVDQKEDKDKASNAPYEPWAMIEIGIERHQKEEEEREEIDIFQESD